MQSSLSPAATALAEKIGRQVRAWRIQKGLRQVDLAEQSGVGEVALRRLERGQGVALSTLLGVLEALGKLSRLEALLDPVRISPMEALNRNLSVPGKPKRAAFSRRRRSRKGAGAEPFEKTPARAGRGRGAG